MRIHIENLLMELEKKNMIFAISEKKHEEETKKQKADI